MELDKKTKNFYQHFKWAKTLDIVASILGIIGIILGIFEAVCYSRNLDIDSLELLISFGNLAINTALVLFVVTGLLVTGFNKGVEVASNENTKK